MASNFDELAEIVGPVLTKKIMEKMGGRILKIRKRMISIQAQYLDEEFFYSEGCTLADGARRLGCTKQTLANLRSVTKKKRASEDHTI